ncbi:MAG: dihydroorotate dehydrogenase [Candidatus Omnitrophota bacterium]
MAENLKLKFAGINLRNPVVLLSGTAGYGKELNDIIDLSRIGALISKTITEKPRVGNPPPRTAETPAGLLNSIGLENPGLEEFIKEAVPFIKRLPLPVLVSIAGNEKQITRMGKRLEDAGMAALEVNLSCPNVSGEFRPASPREIKRLVSHIRKAVKIPFLTKLPPDLFRIQALVKAAEEGGTSGLTIANTFPAMTFDVKKRKPLLGGITGGLSGPAILPLSLYLVFKARGVTKLPILGSGGIYNGTGAVSMLLAGADAVGLGTVTFYQPDAYREILKSIAEFRGHRKNQTK